MTSSLFVEPCVISARLDSQHRRVLNLKELVGTVQELSDNYYIDIVL
jgi:hypothetical protein